MKSVPFLLLSLIIVFLSWSSTLAGPLTTAGIDTARNAMVVAARAEAVEAGLQMLNEGGNAIDAAVAAAFVIGVVEPYASGLGGGGGMIIYLRENNIFDYLDYYVQAPAVVDTGFSSDRDRETARSICVPGTPAGLVSAVEKYGRLPLKKVMQPAIQFARNGFVVNEVFFNAVIEKLEMILKYPETSASYLSESLPYMVGDTLKLPQLALILEGMANQGDAFFYRGDFTSRMVEMIRQGGGLLSETDFKNYQPRYLPPVMTEFKRHQVYSAAPPQSGITLLQILNMVESIEADWWQPFEKNAAAVHWMCEITKRADADRYAYLADPRFTELPAYGLLDKKYAKKRFSEIQSDQNLSVQNRKVTAGNPWPFQMNQQSPSKSQQNDTEGPHTTQISVIDTQGNMVSLTQTLGFFFGSGVSIDGLLFNSGMTNFSRRGVNKLEPNKRPRSTICPTLILKDGKPVAVLGTPGGGTIFNTMAQVVIRLLDFKQAAGDAVEAPRFSTRATSRKVTIEKRYDAEILEDLTNWGYDLQLTAPFDVYMGGVQLIMVDPQNHFYIGISDSRRQGVANGF